MGKQLVTFSIDTDKDRDLARWLNKLAKGGKSKAIREALRLGFGKRTGITHGDIFQAIKDLGHKIGSGTFVVADSQVYREEPDDIAATLDGMGL